MRVLRPVMRLLARTAPFVPGAARPMLRAFASAVGTGPLVGPPPFRRALVLCAHPDDEAVGCAGSLAILAAAGASVHVVYATRGEASAGARIPREEVGRRRQAEAERACKALGLLPPRFLDFGDGTLPMHVDALAVEVAALVAAVQPDVVFVPWFLDGHADHRAMSAAVARVDPLPNVEIWAFEWWTALPLNRLVDVTAVYDRKVAALAEHHTAQAAFDVTAGLSLNRWRSLHGLSGKGYGEAFLAASHSEYCILVQRSAAG